MLIFVSCGRFCVSFFGTLASLLIFFKKKMYGNGFGKPGFYLNPVFHPQGLLEWKCFFSQCTVASNKNTTSRFHPASVAVFQLCQLCLRGPVHYPLSLYKLYFSMLHLAPSNPQLSLLCYLIKPLLLFPPIATCF